MRTRNLAWALVLVAGALVLIQGCGGGGSDVSNDPTPVINFINGAKAGIGTVWSRFRIDGGGFGWFGEEIPTPMVAFRDATTNSIVAYASVDREYGLTSFFIFARVPSGLLAGTTYKLTVTTAGGTSNAVNFLIVAKASFNPSEILWSPSYSLPVAQQGFSAVAGVVGTSTYVYAIGGNTATSGTVDGEKANVNTVYMNPVNDSDGTLGNANWSILAPLPGKRGFVSAVFANSYNSLIDGSALYVLGGLDETGMATTTVYRALLNSDGTIPAAGSAGSWAAMTALPQPLSALGAVIFQNRIYVAGGNDSSGTPVANIYTARINGADGTLGSWETESDLPMALAFHQLVEVAGTLYVLGGDSAAADPISNSQSASFQDAVYSAIHNPYGGLIDPPWTAEANKLNQAREKFSAVAEGGYILVTGGLYGGAPGKSEESYASVDGSLSSFNELSASHMISSLSGYNFYNHGHCVVVDSSWNLHVLILGGADVITGAPHAEVWYQH